MRLVQLVVVRGAGLVELVRTPTPAQQERQHSRHGEVERQSHQPGVDRGPNDRRVPNGRVLLRRQRSRCPRPCPRTIRRSEPMRWNQRVYSPITTAGSVWSIHTPPSSCRSIANFVGRNSTKPSAPDLHHQRDDLRHLRLLACRSRPGRTNSFHTLRVNRLPPRSTSPPPARALRSRSPRQATPTNHDGNMSRNSAGTDQVRLGRRRSRARSPCSRSSAISPSRNVHAGSSDMLRRTTSCERELSTAVIACGYRNSAIAEPSASVAYATCASAPDGISAPGLSRFGSSSAAASKMVSKPPSFVGDVDDRHDDRDVDQRVLDERDHRRRPQPARVRVGGEDREGDDQRPRRRSTPRPFEHELASPRAAGRCTASSPAGR